MRYVIGRVDASCPVAVRREEQVPVRFEPHLGIKALKCT